MKLRDRHRDGRFRRALAWTGALVFAAAIATPVRAAAPRIDQDASARLTSYLNDHNYPLVGARLSTMSDGGKRLLLFGFVASAAAKVAAADVAVAHLAIPGITLINRIEIRPEVGELGGGSGPAPAAAVPMTWDELMAHIQGSPIRLAPDSGVDTPPP